MAQLGTAPSHYFLWTGEPGKGFVPSGVMDTSSMLAASMTLFGMMDEVERRQLHLLMTHSMENSVEEIWTETREGYV